MLHWPTYRVVASTRIMFPQNGGFIFKQAICPGKTKWLQPAREIGRLGSFRIQEKFRAPMLGPADIYFNSGTVSDAARYAEVFDQLKEYTAVHLRDQATATMIGDRRA